MKKASYDHKELGNQSMSKQAANFNLHRKNNDMKAELVMMRTWGPPWRACFELGLANL